MNKRKYVYDPQKQIMMVFDGNRNVGGYIGQIAERKFEKLLLTDVDIEIGEFLTRRERLLRHSI